MEILTEQNVNKINFKIDADKLLAYEFETDVPVLIEEQGTHATIFRLEIHKDTFEKYIMVANEDDYDVMEDVTGAFNLAGVMTHLLVSDALLGIDNQTQEYLEEVEDNE